MITKTRRVVLYENQFQEIVDGEPYPVAPEELVGERMDAATIQAVRCLRRRSDSATMRPGQLRPPARHQPMSRGPNLRGLLEARAPRPESYRSYRTYTAVATWAQAHNRPDDNWGKPARIAAWSHRPRRTGSNRTHTTCAACPPGPT